MKENASALYSKYVIDGLRMEVTPGQMLDAACGQQPVQEEFEPIVDERMDPDPTPVVYDSFRMGEYLEKTAAVLTRKVPADYADSYTRCAIAQALIGMIWREGHFRLDDLHVHMGWKWNEAPVGAMAGFYASVEAACDYLDGLGLQLSGYSYADGRAGARDPMGPQRWYEKAANRGSAEGAYRAGLAYARMGSVWRNKAGEWLRKADSMGHPGAKKALADLSAGALVPAAVPKPAATAGGGVSAAEAHNRGVAASKRPGGMAEAARWFRQAAEQNYGPSCSNLGRLYYLGEGVRQDYAEAVKWYRRGAELGNAVSQHGLAVCYLNGRGIPKNATEAAKWFRKSAEQGYALAQHSLGACYVNGDGVRKDYNEAIKWFRKAAAQGNASSKDALRQLGVR